MQTIRLPWSNLLTWKRTEPTKKLRRQHTTKWSVLPGWFTSSRPNFMTNQQCYFFISIFGCLSLTTILFEVVLSSSDDQRYKKSTKMGSYFFFSLNKKHSPSKNVLSLHRWVWAYDSLEKILSLMRFFAWLKAKCCSTHARSYSSIYKLIKIIFIITMLYCNTSIYYVNLHICLLFWEKLEPEIVESNSPYQKPVPKWPNPVLNSFIMHYTTLDEGVSYHM